MTAPNAEMTIKILLVGNSAVGKTCILLRYSDNKFQGDFLSTIGLDFKVKHMTIDDKPIKLQVWDTAGQEQYRNITQSFLRGADGILLCFDLTNKMSFDQISDWMHSIHDCASTTVDIFLVGNKCDLQDQRKITNEMIEQMKNEYECEYFETSACTGQGINETFERMANVIKKRKDAEPQKQQNNIVRLDNKSEKSKRKKCSI